MRKYCFLLAVAFFSLLSSVPAQQNGQSSITGLLHTQDGDFPNGRVEVILENRGIPIATTYADDEGKFGFSQLSADLYHVVIQDPNYVAVDQTVTFDPLFPRSQVLSIYLTSKSDSNNATEEPGRLGPDRRGPNSGQTGGTDKAQKGSNPYLISAADYNRKFPHDAVKEFEKGSEQFRKGKVDDAIKHYEKALSIAPNFYPARNDLGTAYLEKRDFPMAEQQFEQVLKDNANDPDAYFNLANVKLLTQDFDEGLRLVTQGLSKFPNSANGLFVQGALYRHAGKYADAERSLRNALQADPGLANAHLELANLYRQEENRTAMMAELQAFLKLYPANPMVPQVKSALEKLQAAR